MKYLFSILILFSIASAQDVQDLRADAGIVIEWPDQADSLILKDYGFDIYNYTAESYYLMYDEYDVVIDTGFIIINLPVKRCDANQNGSVNILDITYMIFMIYKGGL